MFLLLLCAVAFFVGLGRPPVERVQEARVLETAREMRAEGGFLLPRLGDRMRLEKPPLAYWLAAIGFSAFDRPSALAGRVYSALAASLAVVALYLFGHAVANRRVGLWAASVLASSRLFLRHGRLAETDMLLTAGATIAFMAFVWPASESRESAAAPPPTRPGRRLWTLAGWAAVAIAFLAKGPAGLFLPVVSAVVYFASRRDWRSLRSIFHPAGPLLFVVLVVPWFALVLARVGFAGAVFWREVEVVAAGTAHGHGVVYSAFYYLLRVWPDFAPWSLLLPLVVVATWRSFSTTLWARVGAVWAAALFVQLEVVGSRQPHYFLPLIPPLALLTGGWIAELSPRLVRRFAVAMVALAIAVSLLWIYVGELRFKPQNFTRAEFAQVAKPLIGKHEVARYGPRDPVVMFYLERSMPPIGVALRRAPVTDPVFLVETTDKAIPPKNDRGNLLIERQINEREILRLYRLR